MIGQPGPIVLMGSGETAPSAQKIYHRLFSQIDDGIRVAVLETPAGFEPNSAFVAGQVGRYLEQRLQNFRPSIQVIPARKRGTPFSPDDAALASALYDANVIFMGPGSPTYTVRQLQDSVLWHTLRACNRLGASVVLASAATLAISRQTMPVYEIYKVGEDLHWKSGLDLLGDFGLATIFVSHWNNSDGGELLDTSRCYIGQARFEALMAMLPEGCAAYTVVGVDENTALVIDPATGICTVMGVGTVTILRTDATAVFAAGQRFSATELGPFHSPAPAFGIPDWVWPATVAGRAAAAQRRATQPAPDCEVLALLDQRQAARARRDWAGSDQIRAQIAARGWRVLDTPTGQTLEPENN
jgi:cyanophycinase-like exopeptidase